MSAWVAACNIAHESTGSSRARQACMLWHLHPPVGALACIHELRSRCGVFNRPPILAAEDCRWLGSVTRSTCSCCSRARIVAAHASSLALASIPARLLRWLQ